MGNNTHSTQRSIVIAQKMHLNNPDDFSCGNRVHKYSNTANQIWEVEDHNYKFAGEAKIPALK